MEPSKESFLALLSKKKTQIDFSSLVDVAQEKDKARRALKRRAPARSTATAAPPLALGESGSGHREPESDDETDSDQDLEDQGEMEDISSYIGRLAAAKGLSLDSACVSTFERLISSVMTRVLEEAGKGSRQKAEGRQQEPCSTPHQPAGTRRPQKKRRTDKTSDDVLTSLHIQKAIKTVLPLPEDFPNSALAKKAWRLDKNSCRGLNLSKLSADMDGGTGPGAMEGTQPAQAVASPAAVAQLAWALTDGPAGGDVVAGDAKPAAGGATDEGREGWEREALSTDSEF